MPSKLPRLYIRIENKYIGKLKKISYKNGRSLNREICQVLIKYIEQHERKHGEIKID